MVAMAVVVVAEYPKAAMYRAGFINADVDECCDIDKKYVIVFTARRTRMHGQCRDCDAFVRLSRRQNLSLSNQRCPL